MTSMRIKAEPAADELKSADDKLLRADSLNIENMTKVHGKLSQVIMATNSALNLVAAQH